MIDPRIQAHFINDHHPLLLRCPIQRAHRRADVARRDDVRAALDGGRDDGRVMGVGNKGDDEVVCGDVCVEAGGGDVELEGGGVWEGGGKGSGAR